MAKTEPNAQILALIRETQKEKGDSGKVTVTSSELAALKGWGVARARGVLNQLVIEGKMRRAFVARSDGWGSSVKVKGFEVV